MNLLSLQQRDYDYSCHALDKIGSPLPHWGLFMHCSVINDTDSYLLTYMQLKTLRDNAERLLASLDRALADKRPNPAK